LKDELLNSLEHYGLNPPDIILEWLEEQDFETMVWPAQSPDLNPIEHFWGYLKGRLAEHEHLSNGIHELCDKVQEEWERMSVEECQKLIESMPRRVQAVLRAKGGYIKYRYPTSYQK
jgi:hypothetical protein